MLKLWWSGVCGTRNFCQHQSGKNCAMDLVLIVHENFVCIPLYQATHGCCCKFESPSAKYYMVVKYFIYTVHRKVLERQAQVSAEAICHTHDTLKAQQHYGTYCTMCCTRLSSHELSVGHPSHLSTTLTYIATTLRRCARNSRGNNNYNTTRRL